MIAYASPMRSHTNKMATRLEYLETMEDVRQPAKVKYPLKKSKRLQKHTKKFYANMFSYKTGYRRILLHL